MTRKTAVGAGRPAAVALDLVLVGFGHVAQRFVTLLDEQRATLQRRHGLTARIIGITTRRHGRAYSARGVDALSLASQVERGESIGDADDARSSAAFIRDAARGNAAARLGRLVVIENTTLDIARGQPAIDHVRTALASGAHVVTANKGPVAFAYRRLARLAERAGRRFLFEGAVMDGVPIFNLVRETLPAVRIQGFRGIVNSTTNYILTAIEAGESFEDALAAMVAAGITEADPSLDVDGWDAAAKTAALANVLLGAALTPHDVEREGLSAGIGERVERARRSGRRLKLVAMAERKGARVYARVAPVEVPESDLLAVLDAEQNALVFQTDLLGDLAVVQRGAGLTQTAYALLADLVTIASDVRSGAGGRQSRARARPGRSL